MVEHIDCDERKSGRYTITRLAYGYSITEKGGECFDYEGHDAVRTMAMKLLGRVDGRIGKPPPETKCFRMTYEETQQLGQTLLDMVNDAQSFEIDDDEIVESD